MAFAKTNVKTSVFGNLKVTYGDWTGSNNDSAGEVVVEGGRVYLADFTNQDPASPAQRKVPVAVSSSSGLNTISVYNHDDVTTGRFLIIHD